MLLKKRYTAFWASTYSVVWFETTYMILFLVSYSTLKIQRNIFLAKISAFAKIVLVGSNVVSTLLRHAYIMQPYKSTLVTREVMIYIFTRILEIPRSLQLVFTAQYIQLAFMSLAYRIPSGFKLEFYSSSPKYLKLLTVSTYSPYILILESQFTNIAYVLSRFIRKAFQLQNYSNLSTKDYRSLGEEATSTTSSAKDKRKS